MLYPFILIVILFITILIYVTYEKMERFDGGIGPYDTASKPPTGSSSASTTVSSSASTTVSSSASASVHKPTQPDICTKAGAAFCDDEKGWYCHEKGDIKFTSENYNSKRNECYFDYKETGGVDGACVKVNLEKSIDKYDSKKECKSRWICHDKVGKCIQKETNRSGSFGSQVECNKFCKFKINPDDERIQDCIKLNDNEYKSDMSGDLRITGQVIYDKKRFCEDRYECEDGRCVRRAGGTYPLKRLCEHDVKLNRCKADPNKNRIKVTFDQDISSFSDKRQVSSSFKEKLKTIFINNGSRIGVFDITDNFVFDTENDKASVIVGFKRDLDESTMNGIISDLSDKPSKINVDFKIFRIVSYTFGESITNIPTIPVINFSKDHIFIIIEYPTSNFKLRTKTLNNMYIDDSKDWSLIKNNLVNKNIDYNPPNDLYLVKTKDIKEYKSTMNEINNKQLIIFDLTKDHINNFRYMPFFEQRLIDSIAKDYKDLKLMIIGTKDTTDIFNLVDEIFFIIYKSIDGLYMYRQLKLDLDLYMDYKFKYLEIGKMTDLNTILLNKSLLDDVYIKLKTGDTTPTYSNILFDMYRPTLDIKFRLNIFKDTKLSNMIIYTEDLSLEPYNITCDFAPKGNTKHECKQMCYNDRENKVNKCKISQCDEKCDNCMNLDCKWNITEYNTNLALKPNRCKIKAFSGNKAIKITWIQPFTKSPVFQYYIIVEEDKTEKTDIYVYNSESDINQFVVNNLDNTKLYNVSVIGKNEFGVGPTSNIESVIPESSKTFDRISKINYSKYSDSIEDYYKNYIQDQVDTMPVKERLENLEREMAINDLKDVLADKLIGSKAHVYNVKVY